MGASRGGPEEEQKGETGRVGDAPRVDGREQFPIVAEIERGDRVGGEPGEDGQEEQARREDRRGGGWCALEGGHGLMGVPTVSP